MKQDGRRPSAADAAMDGGEPAAGKMAFGSGLAVSIAQRSEAGVKPANQDFHGAIVPEGWELASKGIAVAIADGISLSPVARIAAEAAVGSFLTDYYSTPESWTVKTAAGRVLAATNSWLHAQTRRSRHPYDMDRGYVCTMSVLVLKADRAHLFHVGDSRIFRLSGESLEQLTEDHRVVLSSVENYLGRALGMAHEVEIDYRAIEVEVGDTFVLTTDGVHGHVPAREMAQLVAGPDLDAAAADMVRRALENGSRDNLTVQIVRIDGLPERDAMAFPRALPPPPIPDVPSEFEGYHILRRLHVSSRSHIFLATDPETGARVVLKVPSIDLRGDPHYLRRFAMEEWIARRIASPHVLRAPPQAGPRRFAYVVTEYVEGQTLRQWMIDNPRPDLETVRGMVEQVIRGLRAFHRKEMLHQDLRPENVMIDRNGTAKIIDFGSVRVAGVQEAAPGRGEDILGTVQYTAPEYFVGEPAGPAADQFSLGVIAYEMLTGRLPYGAQVSRARTRRARSRLRYAPAAREDRPIPDWIDAALRKAVHPDPRQRYPVLSELAEDLRRPNPALARSVPLIERNPLLFWQALSFLLGLAVLVLLATR